MSFNGKPCATCSHELFTCNCKTVYCPECQRRKGRYYCPVCGRNRLWRRVPEAKGEKPRIR